jgi:exopolyphosphatase / guanosine-5'-triphosphate,3'-diphosphate pyrophosphatase
MRLAAIDLGTNTVRLMIADVSPSGLSVVDRGLEITRLGQRVDRRRRLHPDAVSRNLTTLEGFVSRAREAGAERTRIAATSVLRDAEDGDAFAQSVEERTGVRLEVLDGEDEGRIAFLGATFELDDGAFVICDIGGGSTELVRGQGGDVRGVSLDIGSVRLTERFLVSDPPTASEIEAARTLIEDLLSGVQGVTGAEVLVGVAGTVTTLAASVLELIPYDRDRVHHSRLTAEVVRRWSERLLASSIDEIKALGTVEPGRADVIAAGVLILRSVMEHWGWDEVLVSERDILDGLVLDLAEGAGRDGVANK